MAHITTVSVRETVTGTTSPFTRTGAVANFLTFATEGVTNDTCWCTVEEVDANGNRSGVWAYGLFTLGAAGALTATTVIRSSSGTSLPTFGAGTKHAYISDSPDTDITTLAADGEVLFRDGATISGATKVLIDPADGVLNLDNMSGVPAVPTTGVKVFSRQVAGRRMPAFVGPSGLDSALQPLLGRNKLALWSPAGNSTTISALGAAALTATGTETAANVATTNAHTWQKRLDYLVTTASATAVAGFRYAQLQWGRGNAAGRGGFHLIFRWGPATGVATSTNRCFVGMRGATSAPTDVNPSTLTNIIGTGWDSADTNIQFMVNDGSGAATKIDLGASFPRPTADRTESYETALFCAPNGSEIFYEFTNLATGAVATGSVTTDIPAATQLLTPNCYMSVGGTSSVIGLTLMLGSIETDL